MTTAAQSVVVARPPDRRAGAVVFLACVLALAAGGSVLGLRLLGARAAHQHSHVGPPGLGTPARTSFGQLEVESIAQIRGLTPKALAGMTHGIQSLVRADEMQVQLVVALQNQTGRKMAYDAAAFRLRVGRGDAVKTFGAVTTSVRAGVLAPKSVMETTVGFVIKRFNRPGSRISLVFADAGQAPVVLDLGPVRRAGTTAAAVNALYAGHHH